MLVATMTAFTFTSCEDVPAAYEIPGGGNGGNGGSTEIPTLYSEAFDDNTTAFEFKDVNLTGGLTRVWKVASYNNNGYLNASAFSNNASHASESWAVSPAINLSDSKKAVLAFSHAINKLSDTSTMKDMMTVWASTDYTGDVSAATWKQLVVPNYPAGTSWTFVESGDIDLTEYCGNKVYIGFKYTSTDENSGGWEVDNFTIKGDGTPMVTPGKPDTPDTPDTPSTEPDQPETSTASTYTLVNQITDGTYVLVAKTDAGYLAASPLAATYNYGYLKNPVSVTESNGTVKVSDANAFTIKKVNGGYTIQDATGYYFMNGAYNSFSRSAELPASGHIWTITVNSDKTVSIKNNEMGKTIQYDTEFTSFGAYEEIKAILPFLYKK